MQDEELENLEEEQLEEEAETEEITETEEQPTEEQQPSSERVGDYTLEELLEMARKGYHIWYDRRYNRIRLRDPETRKTISIPYDEAIYERLRKAKEEAKKGKKEGGAEEATEKRGRPKAVKPVTDDIALWNTFIGKHRPLIESLISRVGWLQDAIIDIGINSLLFAMLVSREQPDKLREVMTQIHDKDAFVAYIMDKLHSIYTAAQGLDKIEELKLKVRELEMYNAILYDSLMKRTEELRKAREMIHELKRKLDIAISIMSKKELKQFMRAIIISGMARRGEEIAGEAQSPPQESNINMQG